MVVVVVVVAALAGGAAGAGLLAATGALDSAPSSTTTTVVRQVSGGSARTSGLNAGSVYASTAAGVVDITVRGTTTVQSGPFGEPQSRETTASGSGFVIDATGHIVTAAHMVDNASSITVKLQDGTGNSGGPLLDSRGRVIGVVDQIASEGAEQSSGVGFAVPIDLVSKDLPSLIAGQRVSHAYLGLSTSNATSSRGALVGQVTSGSPADQAGVNAGDIITALSGTAIKDSNALVAAIADHHPGDTVTLAVRRGSSTLHLTAKLGTQPTQTAASTG